MEKDSDGGLPVGKGRGRRRWKPDSGAKKRTARDSEERYPSWKRTEKAIPMCEITYVRKYALLLLSLSVSLARSVPPGPSLWGSSHSGDGLA